MGRRKVEKVTALLTGIVVICLSLYCKDWHSVGIYVGCEVQGRMLYPFFHANILHAALNVWCLLSLVFIYDIKMWRLLITYVIAVTIPITALSSLVGGMTSPTVGLSGVVFALFGTISFEVIRKWYYQAWMIGYLILGFLFPATNAWLHLYCYLVGFLVALLNKPIKARK